MSERVYLIDGSGYIFRAYYAVSTLTTSVGFPTNALFGFTRMLLKLLKDVDGGHVAIVFDAGRETFRNELYPQYKANRAECPEDLLKQMPYFREIAQALGLRMLELTGFEADDVIGTLVRRLSKTGVEIFIVSGDKDLMQLVGAGVVLWDSMRDKYYNPEEVRAKLGVSPEQVVDFLGLTGDDSDNIPGVSGVGPKTAAQLIEKYGDIEQILASAGTIRDDVQIRNRAKISSELELKAGQVRLSKRLAQVECNAPVYMEAEGRKVMLSELSDADLLKQMGRMPVDAVALRRFIERFEFQSLFKDFNFDSVPAASNAKPNQEEKYKYRTVYAENFDEWFHLFVQQKKFAFDLETTALAVWQAEIVGLAFCWSDNEAWYIPVAHCNDHKQPDNFKQPDAAQQQMALGTVLEKCAPIFADATIKKCGQNLKYDISILARYGLEVQGIDLDTMVASYLIAPDRRSHSLAALALDFLGLKASEYEDVTKGLQNFSYVSIAAATAYSCEDAHFAWILAEIFREKLNANGLERVCWEIEMPLISVLCRMEMKGIKIDSDYLHSMSDEFGQQLRKLEESIYSKAGCEFNINSPKQLADVLFNRLSIPAKGVKKNKTGYSTDSNVLEKLAEEHELPALILNYRSLHKLKSTYVDSLPQQVVPLTGRLHTKFNQTVTGTGRLSSSDPNLQNIPIQSNEGRRVRRAFVPERGYCFISADYSQIELRLLAHMSSDKILIAAFEDNVDVHAQTAREILGLDPRAEVDNNARRLGKTMNFGILYGMSGFRLARELGIPVALANKYIEGYFEHYSGVSAYFDKVAEQAEKDGYVRTLWGRKRILTDVDVSGRDRGFLRRVAINAPIQGSAADIVKRAMVCIDKTIRSKKLPVAMLLQIHDELLFECRADACAEVKDLIQYEMEHVIDLSVPLRVEIGVGMNWEEAH